VKGAFSSVTIRAAETVWRGEVWVSMMRWTLEDQGEQTVLCIDGATSLPTASKTIQWHSMYFCKDLLMSCYVFARFGYSFEQASGAYQQRMTGHASHIARMGTSDAIWAVDDNDGDGGAGAVPETRLRLCSGVLKVHVWTCSSGPMESCTLPARCTPVPTSWGRRASIECTESQG